MILLIGVATPKSNPASNPIRTDLIFMSLRSANRKIRMLIHSLVSITIMQSFLPGHGFSNISFPF